MRPLSLFLLQHSITLLVILSSTTTTYIQQVTANNCGIQASNALCPNNYCCSQYGWCGSGEPWCGDGCQTGPCYGSSAPTISPRPTKAPNTAAPYAATTCEVYRNTVNFGYYEEWAEYRGTDCNNIGPNEIDVDAFGYTHLAFSFAGISSSGVIEPYNGNTAYYTKYAQFNSLKDANPTLKTLIAVGGWTFDQTRFSNVASTDAKRTSFADSVVTFLDTHNFDGIDIDWEYPVTRQGTPQDYANYPLLCQALRTAFDNAGHSSSDPEPWLITIATSINIEKIEMGYDMVAMSDHVDWFNIMSYDIYGSWDSTAGANTDMRYIESTFQYIFSLGVKREQLVLGLAAYGRSSKLASPTCTTIGCEIWGAGLSGCHGESGNLPWFQIKEQYVDVGPSSYDSLTFNPTTGSMELVTGGNLYFTSFDNDDTFNIKYQYAWSQCLRGIMWWAVDLIKEPIALLETVPTSSPTKSEAPSISLVPSTQPSVSLSPTKSPDPTKSPTPPPTSSPTVTPPCGSSCPAGATGNYATYDCAGFYQCVSGGNVGQFACAPGTLFDENLGVCNWSYSVTCNCSTPSPPTPATPPGEPTSSPTPKPTNAPIDAEACGSCSVAGTTMIPSIDCTGFYYCSGGEPSALISCGVNTLFDSDRMICDWAYEVDCTCTSGGGTPPAGPGPTPISPPGPAPTPTPPSPPTGTDPWYPDWQRTSTCANDGLQPSWMGDGYFTSSQTDCCAAWFWWQDGIQSTQNCMDA